MVTITARIKRDEQSELYIERFNNNILSKPFSNLMFKDDSFIKFVHLDIVVIYLNILLPVEIPFFIIVLSYLLAVIFHLTFLYYIGTAFAVIMLSFKYIIYGLFKLGLHKLGFKGKIEAL